MLYPLGLFIRWRETSLRHGSTNFRRDGDDYAAAMVRVYHGLGMDLFLRETFLPCLRASCEPLTNAGIKVIYHSDGNLMEIMNDLLDCGIAGLNPIESICGMDLGVLKKRYGKNLILVGGMDCSQLLPLGTIDDIEAAVREAMQVAAPGGGLFIGSSSEIVPATPLENVLAFYRLCRTYGRYPIRG